MKKLLRKIGNWFIELFDSKGRRSKKIAQFLHYNKDLLIIVADPKTDRLLMGYRDKIVTSEIKNAEGHKTRVVKGVLSHSLFKKEIDNFIVSIAESLKLKLEDGNQFYQWIDGALYNIAKALRIERKIKKEDNLNINNQQNNQANKAVRAGGDHQDHHGVPVV